MAAELIDNNAVFIHCSAGLGRSGTISFALMLYKDYSDLMEMDDGVVSELFNRFNQLNKYRPGSIQNSQQLKNALDIAHALHYLSLQLKETGQPVADYLEELATREASMNPVAELEDTDSSEGEVVSAASSASRSGSRCVSVRLFSRREAPDETPCDESVEKPFLSQ